MRSTGTARACWRTGGGYGGGGKGGVGAGPRDGKGQVSNGTYPQGRGTPTRECNGIEGLGRGRGVGRKGQVNNGTYLQGRGAPTRGG